MLGIASGAILVPLNSTMLAVALPSIMSQFGVDAVTVSSLVTLYLGAVTIALLASGSLGDRYGQRPVFLIGVVAFAFSSLLAVIAPSFEILAASRVLQAISGALVSTTSVALIRALSPANERGAAFGVFDMLVSTSAAIGPFIGGVLVGAFGWQSLFVLAVPVAIFAAVVVAIVVPADTPRRSAVPGRCVPHGP
jgi:MFS family permease